MAEDFWEQETEDAMSEEEANNILENVNNTQEELIEELSEESEEEEVAEAEEEEQDALEAADLEVLKNARLRLEQGKLYEMLLKHDLFEGVEADTKAISNVQREIKAFVKERLEVLVGLRPDPRLKPVKSNTGLEIFSDVELQVLKEFVGKVVKPKAEESKPAPVRQAQSEPSLRPVKGNVKVVQKQKTAKKVAPKPQAPAEQKGLTKPPSEMTIQELKEYNQQIAKRQAAKKAPIPAKRIPMPDSQQINTLYSSRVQADPGQSLVGAIMQKMGKPLGTVEYVGDGGGGYDSNDDRI